MKNFKKAFIERALKAKMNHHPDHEAGQPKSRGGTKKRKGSSAKTVITDTECARIEAPREREGSFEAQPIGKHKRHLTSFDRKIIAGARDTGFMAEMYAVDVSPDLISSVTDAVLSEVAPWQARPLEAMYPVVFFDALCVKIRGDSVVHSVKLARLQPLQAEIDQNAEAISASRLGTIERVLVKDAARKTPNALSGPTDCNRPVVFSGQDRLMGKLVDIRITEAPMRSLRGEVVTAGYASPALSSWAEAA